MKNIKQYLTGTNILVFLLCVGVLVAIAGNVYHYFLKPADAPPVDKMSIVLKKLEIVESSNVNLVKQVQDIKSASASELRRVSDSIFKVVGKDYKNEKGVDRFAVTKESVDLHTPIVAEFKGAQVQPAGNDSCLKIPALFGYESDSISFDGVIDTNGVALTGLHIPNTMYARDVISKSGFLNLGRKSETQLYNTNSLWSNDSAAVYKVDKTPNWWYRWGKPTLIAAGSATLTGIIVHQAKK